MPYTFAQQINPLFHGLSNIYGQHGWFITPTIEMSHQQAKRKKRRQIYNTEQANRFYQNARRFLNLLHKRTSQKKLHRVSQDLPAGKTLDYIRNNKAPELVALFGTDGHTHLHIGLWTDNDLYTHKEIQSCWTTIAKKHLRQSYQQNIKIQPINPNYSFVGRYIADHHRIKPLRVWGNQEHPLVTDINRLIEAELTYLGRHEASKPSKPSGKRLTPSKPTPAGNISNSQ